MFLATLPFPDIDRVALHIWGPLAIRWYALAYIAGLLFGWWAAARMTHAREPLWKNPPFNRKAPITADQIGDLVVWATFGVILGGRIGWILFYGIALCSVSPESPISRPAARLPMACSPIPSRLITVWEGGMSFHGGLAGVAIAVWLFCRRHKLELLQVADMIAVVAPIGLFFGRIANFVNGELWGKVTDVPWAMVFCTRHILEQFGGLPGRRAAAPSQPTLRSGAGRPGAVRDPADRPARLPPARAAGPADRHVLRRLWPVPLLRRILPRAGRAVPGLVQHGHGAFDSALAGGGLLPVPSLRKPQPAHERRSASASRR